MSHQSAWTPRRRCGAQRSALPRNLDVNSLAINCSIVFFNLGVDSEEEFCRSRCILRRWEYPDKFAFEDSQRMPGTLGVHEMRYVAAPRIANATLAKNYDW